MLLVLLLWMCELFSFSTAQQECGYTYVRQPLTQLRCNPYGEREIILKCEVNGPSKEVFDILWFRQTQSKDRPEELVAGGRISSHRDQGFLYPDGTVEHDSIMRLSPLTEEDIGQYWCVVRVNNVTLLERSDVLNLTSEQSYNGWRACRSDSRDYNTGQRTCADLPSSSLLSTTTPSVSPTELNIEPTSTITYPMRSSTSSTPFPTGTPYVNPTNEPTSITTATEPGRTSSKSTVDITAATTEGDPSSSSNQAVVLYSILAVIVVFVAVFITVTVVIAVSCAYVKLYNHQKPNQRVQANQPPATTN